MTDAGDQEHPIRQTFGSGIRGSEEAFLRQGGRDFLLAFYAALRNLRLYPVENVQVQRALDEVHGLARKLLDVDPELEVRLAGEFIFINATRLRLGLDNYSSFSHILTTLRQCGIGAVYVDENVERREWQVFLSLILSFASREADTEKLGEVQHRLNEGGVTHIALAAPFETEEPADAEEAKAIAKRTYEQHQEGETRGPGDRRSDSEERDIHGRSNDHP